MEWDRARGTGGAVGTVSRFALPNLAGSLHQPGRADSALLLIFAPSIYMTFRRQCSVEG